MRRPRSRRTRASVSNQNDDVTRFLTRAADLVREGLPEHIVPDRNSKWAIKESKYTHPDWRAYRMWYSTPPWSNNDDLTYFMHVNKTIYKSSGDIAASVGLAFRPKHIIDSGFKGLEWELNRLRVYDNQSSLTDAVRYESLRGIRVGYAFPDLSPWVARALADLLIGFIEAATPVVTEFVESRKGRGP